MIVMELGAGTPWGERHTPGPGLVDCVDGPHIFRRGNRRKRGPRKNKRGCSSSSGGGVGLVERLAECLKLLEKVGIGIPCFRRVVMSGH